MALIQQERVGRAKDSGKARLRGSSKWGSELEIRQPHRGRLLDDFEARYPTMFFVKSIAGSIGKADAA
jgi:hypothetical protein